MRDSERHRKQRRRAGETGKPHGFRRRWDSAELAAAHRLEENVTDAVALQLLGIRALVAGACDQNRLP